MRVPDRLGWNEERLLLLRRHHRSVSKLPWAHSTTDATTTWQCHLMWTFSESRRTSGTEAQQWRDVLTEDPLDRLVALPTSDRQLRQGEERHVEQDDPSAPTGDRRRNSTSGTATSWSYSHIND